MSAILFIMVNISWCILLAVGKHARPGCALRHSRKGREIESFLD